MIITARTPEGQWVEPSMMVDRVPDGYAERWAAAVAETLGLERLVAVVSETDPREGDLIADPNVTSDPDPPPDHRGFMAAARDALGRDVAIDLANAYPSVLIALREGDFDTARYGVERMAATNVIDEDTRQALHALMTEAGIPESIE